MLVQFSLSVISHSLRPHGLQYARPPCPSPTPPRVYSKSCPLSQWCYSTISSSVIPSSCLQSFPPSGSFQMSQFFASGGLSIGVSASASVLPMRIQDWFPLGWTMLSILQTLLYLALTKKCVREILSLLHRGINWGTERLNGHTLNLFNRD